MELKLLYQKFEQELEAIEMQPSDILESSTLAINLSRDCLHTIKMEIIKHGFDNKNKEIEFFKVTKQIPLIPLIYYSEIRSFEIQFPKGNADCQRKYIKKKINKLNRFFLYNMDFVQYIDSGFTHFDEHYYTRDFLATYHITSSKFYFQDPDFSTSRDMLLGKVKAYKKFIIYLQNRFFQKKSFNSHDRDASAISNLRWTGSKVALTELAIALKYSGSLNNGNISFKDTIVFLQNLFDIDLGEFHHTAMRLKNRSQPTKFMDNLRSSVETWIEKSDL